VRVVAAIVLCLAAAGAAAAEVFPAGHVFRPLLADPAEPRSFVSLLRAEGRDAVLAGGRLLAGVDIKGFALSRGLRRLRPFRPVPEHRGALLRREPAVRLLTRERQLHRGAP